MLNALVVVAGIGAVQCLLFALLITVKKERKRSDWLLLIWFLVFAIHLLLAIGKQVAPISIVKVFIATIGFLHGPFFLLYTKAIFRQALTKIDGLHFLPFLLFTACSFFIEPAFEQSWEIIILFSKLASLIAYPLYILYLYQQKIRRSKRNSADNRILMLAWIRIIAILFLISIGISLIRLSTELWLGVAYFELWDVLRYVIWVTVIGFYGLKYGMVYQPEPMITPIVEDKKYKHSPLKSEEIEILVERINRFFEEQEAYREPNFSLALLSKSLDIPKHHLSQIINAEMKTTFYGLVNAKRVTYATKKIKEGTNLTLEGLGYESGFNSKSAFFHHFKKTTGKTPGQFKKEISTD